MKPRLIAFVSGLGMALALGSYAQINGGGPNGGGGGGGGSGTVTSVSMTAPAIFAVGGSPVTTAGTLGLTFATGQTANRVIASPNGAPGAVGLRALVAADLPPISLTAGVTGTLPTTSGGTGDAGTFTGIPMFNSIFAATKAVSANVISLWTGTCSSSTFLRGDGACASAGGGSGRPTYAQFNTSLGSCSLDSSFSNSGFTSCFSSATGVFTVSFSSAYTNPPICNVTGVGINANSHPTLAITDHIFGGFLEVDMFDAVSDALYSGGTFAITCTGT